MQTRKNCPPVTDSSNSDLRLKTLEAMHDNAVDAIITIDERGVIETVNPATESLFGYQPAEIIGRNVNILMPSPYREEHDQYMHNYLQGGLAKVIGIGREVVARKKDGTIFPIHLAVSEIQLGDRRVFAGFVRDLSGLKLVEEQRATLGRIIENSLNEVFIFDAESLRFIQVNRGARENLGYSVEELYELSPVDIKPDYRRGQFQSEVVRPLLNKEVEQLKFITVHQRKDGTTYDVDVHVQLAAYLNKPVLVAIILDITERLQAERRVQQQQEIMKAELERLVETRTAELKQAQADLVRSEKYSTLGKVSGGIAHEIRNPLNAVKTSAYYLLNAKSLSPEKITEHLERIDRQVAMIDSVVTALSDVAKLPDATLSPIAMEPILRDVVGSVQLPANIEKVFEFPDSLPDVLADVNQIGIAFQNLVRNARDAMPDGGTLTIRAEVHDDSVVFFVIDDGIGISDQILENILEPLFTTKARGMGLGLSITLAIIEKNQGKLSIESSPGTGSIFSISLKRQL